MPIVFRLFCWKRDTIKNKYWNSSRGKTLLSVYWMVIFPFQVKKHVLCLFHYIYYSFRDLFFCNQKAFEPQWTVKEKHYCTCTFLTFLLVLSFFIWSCILFKALPYWGDFQSVLTKRFLCCQVLIIRKSSHTQTVIHSRNDRCVILTHMQLNWFQ